MAEGKDIEIGTCIAGSIAEAYYGLPAELKAEYEKNMTVYAAVGIVSVKTGVMNKERLGSLSGLVTKIIMPILLFTNVTTSVTMTDFYRP